MVVSVVYRGSEKLGKGQHNESNTHFQRVVIPRTSRNHTKYDLDLPFCYTIATFTSKYYTALKSYKLIPSIHMHACLSIFMFMCRAGGGEGEHREWFTDWK